jgi:hypothetical protein
LRLTRAVSYLPTEKLVFQSPQEPSHLITAHVCRDVVRTGSKRATNYAQRPCLVESARTRLAAGAAVPRCGGSGHPDHVLDDTEDARLDGRTGRR